jgi:hypothetical protein
MNNTVRNIFAVLLGLLIGSLVNWGLIWLSAYIIPPPAGTTLTSTEGLKAAMKLMEPKHFIFPFLSHAIGTMVGSFVTASIVIAHKMRFAFLIGFIFLLGGIFMVYTVPAPWWFMAVDLVGAYIPMAFFGGDFTNVNEQ